MRRVAVAGIAIAFVLVVLGPARAQPVDCNALDPCAIYLPTILTTAPPPSPPSTAVLQPDDMIGFTVDAWHELTNAAASENYRDPPAARAAFEAQGRETSWYARYVSSSGSLIVSSQAIRYATPEGADAGMDYALADELTWYAYDTPRLIGLGDRALFCTAVVEDGGLTYMTRYYTIRKGRHVAIVRFTWDSGPLDGWSIAQLAVDRLP